MNMNSLSPYIRMASDNKITSPFCLERVIFDYELLYVKEGSIIIEVNGIKYEGNSGDLFLLKPLEKHTISIDIDFFRQYAVHFDLYQLEDSPEVKVSFKKFEEMSAKEQQWFRADECSGPLITIPTKIHLQHTHPVEKLFLSIIHEYEGKAPYSLIRLKGLFLELWSYILRELFISSKSNVFDHQAQLNDVKSYIEQNFSQNISISELAKRAKLSKYYFMRLFKELYGISPLRYQQLARIDQAKELLQFTPLTVQEIAFSVGYESIQSFSRAFSKVESVPPTYYRSRSQPSPAKP